MLVNNHSKSLSCFAKNLLSKNTRSYIKQKQIDQISKKYGQGAWQKAKLITNVFKHIFGQGMKEVKADFNVFKQLRKKQILSEEMTPQELKSYQRMRNDFRKLGPLIIIQILPFSGPLFILYMYTYPGSIPSWFMIDYYHDRHEQLKVKNQEKTLQMFKERKLKPQQINLDTMPLRDLKKLCLLLFGFYRDGTVGYRKVFNKKLSFFISEEYSRFLIKRDLKKRFERNLTLAKETRHLETLQQKVQYLCAKIMIGEHRMVYQPMYQHTLEKMQKNQGKESDFFGELKKSALQETKKTQAKPENDNNKKPNSK